MAEHEPHRPLHIEAAGTLADAHAEPQSGFQHILQFPFATDEGRLCGSCAAIRDRRPLLPTVDIEERAVIDPYLEGLYAPFPFTPTSPPRR